MISSGPRGGPRIRSRSGVFSSDKQVSPREVPRAAQSSLPHVPEVSVKTRCFRSGGLVLVGLLLVCGCSSTKESASKDKLTADVGKYAPPPRELGDNKPRIGVPPFKVSVAPG